MIYVLNEHQYRGCREVLYCMDSVVRDILGASMGPSRWKI